MKVYCRSCKYYSSWSGCYGGNYEECGAPSNEYHEDTHTQRLLLHRQTPKDKNANNDCKDYKKKWWAV